MLRVFVPLQLQTRIHLYIGMTYQWWFLQAAEVWVGVPHAFLNDGGLCSYGAHSICDQLLRLWSTATSFRLFFDTFLARDQPWRIPAIPLHLHMHISETKGIEKMMKQEKQLTRIWCLEREAG